MIFVTVGSQMPFDRLIRAVDNWARDHPQYEVVAQIGNSGFVPQVMEYHQTLPPSKFARTMAAASVVVAHAGMGTIISAAEYGKPMVLLPRRGDLRETRNDHQIATAKWLETKSGISVAYHESELDELLERQMSKLSDVGLSGTAPVAMVAALKSIVSNL